MTFEDRKSPVIELQGDVCFLTSHDVNQKEFLRFSFTIIFQDCSLVHHR